MKNYRINKTLFQDNILCPTTDYITNIHLKICDNRINVRVSLV